MLRWMDAPRNGVSIGWLACCAALAAARASAAGSELPGVSGWQIALPTPGTHRACTEVGSAGDGAAKLVGTAGEPKARGVLMQEFLGKQALTPAAAYRYAVRYRTDGPLDGYGLVLIDAYTAEGEKGRTTLVSQRLAAADPWTAVEGRFTVPPKAVRVRLLLYLHGRGTIYYDDAFVGEPAAGAANLLRNGSFNPPGSAPYELAPEKRSGAVRLSADLDNGTLGRVKQLGPDEFYLHAFPEGKPRSPFLWFHFRVDGGAGREVTFHVNPAPFDRQKTGGNGTRSPVVSDDGRQWDGVARKSWNEDGSVLTFRHRFQRSPAWVASFYPFTPDHVTRFAAQYRSSPHFRAVALGKTGQGRDLPRWTITDRGVPDDGKRCVLFTALQHDLETTGAMALEGLARYLLSDEDQAARLRRRFVFHLLPMMNPDGIAAGNLYCPVGNLNRQWGLGTAPETTLVERFAKELTARGRPIELFMDFHGWCTPQRSTVFMTFGPAIADAASHRDAAGLVEAIKPRLQGKVQTTVWNKMVSHVTMGETDLRRLSCGWMKFEAPARLSYSIEIFGEGECTQAEYLAWGRAFGEGIADFYQATPPP